MNGRAGESPARVVRVITRLNVGGPARQALLLTRALEQRGFEPELLFGSETPNEGHLPPAGVRHVHIPSMKRDIDPVSDVRAWRVLARLMRASKPQIVHTHLAKAGALGRLAARRAGVPIIVHTFHGHVLERYFSSPTTRLFVGIERRLALRTDALIAVSASVRDELLAMGIGRPDHWHVMPVGVEIDDLLRSDLEIQEARLRLGLPTRRPLIGFVGRLVAVKDLPTFIDAAARVAGAMPTASFVVAGDGELRKQVESRARGVLGSRVHFTGWVSDLPSLYAALDVVVLTSLNEGTPTALIEAGAAGTPVVATRVGGVPDVVRDGVTGLLAPPKDAHGIAQRVIGLLGDADRRRAMGVAARHWVRDRFSGSRLVDDTASLYRELLARSSVTGAFRERGRDGS
jgi:glycosyltransferase involved in cell wall biosynthesis